MRVTKRRGERWWPRRNVIRATKGRGERRWPRGNVVRALKGKETTVAQGACNQAEERGRK